MDKLKLNNSLLDNKKIILDFFRLNYKDLPDNFDKLDEDIKNTLSVIDEAYINNSINFDEAIYLMSQLFGGSKIKDKLNNKKMNTEEYYDLLINNKIDKDKLNELMDSDKINYQMYYDGLKYLSDEENNDLSFSR